MVQGLKGKTAIVTGAATGICRETALSFAREGTSVVVADINSRGGKETVQMATDEGGEAIFIQADVARASQVRDW